MGARPEAPELTPLELLLHRLPRTRQEIKALLLRSADNMAEAALQLTPVKIN